MPQTKDRDDLRLLLVQVRKDQTMKLHEITCFETSGGLGDSQVLAHDLLETPVTAEELDSVDGVIIGGSGDFSVLDPVPNLDSLVELAREARFRNLPILGSSWGAQFLAYVFGGRVIHDSPHRELGSVRVTLLPPAKHDPLFSGLPDSFWVQSGHKDRIAEPPYDAVLLATNSSCPVQAFTFPSTRIYGFQFHPEFSKEDVVMRLRHYRENYVNADESVDHFIAGLKPSPEAYSLVEKWIDRVVLAP